MITAAAVAPPQHRTVSLEGNNFESPEPTPFAASYRRAVWNKQCQSTLV